MQQQVYNFVLRDLVRYEKAIKNGKAGNQGREESWNHRKEEMPWF